jgi:hypothetical protein
MHIWKKVFFEWTVHEELGGTTGRYAGNEK